MRTLCILATDTDTLERALKLWDESKPIAGTLAARYLTDIRKLDLAALSADDAMRARARGWVVSQAVIALAYYTVKTNPGLVREAERWFAAALDDRG